MSHCFVRMFRFEVGMTADEWCLQAAWLCHLSAHWTKERLRLFRRMLHAEFTESYSHMPRRALSTELGDPPNRSGGFSATDSKHSHHLRDILKRIQSKMSVHIDMLTLSESIAAASSAEIDPPPTLLPDGASIGTLTSTTSGVGFGTAAATTTATSTTTAPTTSSSTTATATAPEKAKKYKTGKLKPLPFPEAGRIQNTSNRDADNKVILATLEDNKELSPQQKREIEVVARFAQAISDWRLTLQTAKLIANSSTHQHSREAAVLLRAYREGFIPKDIFDSRINELAGF